MPRQVVVERSFGGQRWVETIACDALTMALAQRFGVPEVVGRLLAGRGIGLDDAERFLAPRLRDWLVDPSHLLDLDQAAAHLADAVQRRERLGIISDYDVDGASSAALFQCWAKVVDVATSLRIPARLTDGYGPSPALFEALRSAGCRTVLVLDSGTTAFEALAYARDRGLDVIVVDHHQAEAALPAALAVINPNRQDQTSPCTHLAAVGVTFLLLVGVNRELRRRGHFEAGGEPDLLRLLDLVALGTVADVVPLVGLNRAFVCQGLQVAGDVARPGIAALMTAARLDPPLNARHIGFGLGPRLNAAGRLADATLAVELLTTDDPVRAEHVARQLDALNAERREVEQNVADQALRQLEAQAAAGRRVGLAVGEHWHPGVLGIVAGRLAERFHRPVLVAGGVDDAYVGSARAPLGFDLGAALRKTLAAGLARKAGGHARAGGFTVARAGLAAFHAAMEAEATAPDLAELRLDATLAPGGCSARLVEAVACLEPYGEGHPTPRFRITDARLVQARIVGGRHVKLGLRGSDGTSLGAVAFRSVDTPLGDALLGRVGETVQLAGKLQIDRYGGQGRAEILVDDAAPWP